MDNYSKNRQNENLGVNKMGKNIRKSPMHQPSFPNNPPGQNNQQPQPQVYNISKNDFRNIVQQLTGSPSHDNSHTNNPLLPRPPPQNPEKPQSMRLQRIRPPPLTPIMNLPRHTPPPAPPPATVPVVGPPPPPSFPAQFGQQQFPTQMPSPTHGVDPASWANPTESPISAYMRYLQNTLTNPSPIGQQMGQSLSPYPGQQMAQVPGQGPSSGLLPTPPMAPFQSPLPSPTSQFLLPSPTGFLNLLSPRSPYPLLSPGIQFSPSLTPNFSFSSMGHLGILGPGPTPPPPPSPGIVFPLSPSGFFPISSPRWRGQ